MPLSDVEERLVKDGLQSHPAVRQLVRIARLALQTRTAQKAYFSADFKDKSYLLGQSKAAERELDAALADTPKQENLDL